MQFQRLYTTRSIFIVWPVWPRDTTIRRYYIYIMRMDIPMLAHCAFGWIMRVCGRDRTMAKGRLFLCALNEG